MAVPAITNNHGTGDELRRIVVLLKKAPSKPKWKLFTATFRRRYGAVKFPYAGGPWPLATMADVDARVMPIPNGLTAAGTDGQPFTPVMALAELPDGTMRRFTRGDQDFLIVSVEPGICVTDDRCPHMSAPLSLGQLEGCLVACPLHKGQFDLQSGDVVQFPTTGGLDARGGYHAPWTPPGAPEKPEPTDLKAQARALTRVRLLRYYPVRIVGDMIEVQLPG